MYRDVPSLQDAELDTYPTRLNSSSCPTRELPAVWASLYAEVPDGSGACPGTSPPVVDTLPLRSPAPTRPVGIFPAPPRPLDARRQQ